MREFKTILKNAGIKAEKTGQCGDFEGEKADYYIISNDTIEQAWKLARESVTDACPIIVDSRAIYKGKFFFEEGLANKDCITKGIKNLESFDAVAWLEKKWRSYKRNCKKSEPDYISCNLSKFDNKNIKYDPNLDIKLGIPEFVTELNYRYDKLALVLIPKVPSYLIPIYIGFGAVNSIPFPDKLSGILKYWNENYGATLAGILFDVIEIYVTKPPKTYEESYTLAKQICSFADEIHSPHTKMVKVLTSSLVTCNVWRFWWD